jgi:hypothetical protein
MPEPKLLTPEELACIEDGDLPDDPADDVRSLLGHIRALEAKHAGELAAWKYRALEAEAVIVQLRRERDEAREIAETYRRKAEALDALNADLAKLTASLPPEVQKVVRNAIGEYLEPKEPKDA